MMNFLDQCSKENIHNRNIDISTYSWDDEHILLVGELKEQRYVACVNPNGDKVAPGTYHHMKIQLLIAIKTMTIKDLDVRLCEVPRDECRTLSTSLENIKGMTISKGFTSRILKMAGANKGCAHLNTLLLAMAPAALQGYWVYSSFKRKEGEQPDSANGDYLVDSCWAWRKDGPLASALAKGIKK